MALPSGNPEKRRRTRLRTLAALEHGFGLYDAIAAYLRLRARSGTTDQERATPELQAAELCHEYRVQIESVTDTLTSVLELDYAWGSSAEAAAERVRICLEKINTILAGPNPDEVIKSQQDVVRPSFRSDGILPPS